jgi:type II secretory pathway predicted ATPase ExeA
MLQARLPDTIDVVFLSNPRIDPADVLHAIAHELRLRVAKTASRLDVQNALQRALLKMHAKGGRVVVFVEEAQGAPLDTLEEIRLLTNLETEREKLLQIVLFGQPELDTLLADARIRQLRERITHSFSLMPLPADLVAEYVRHRLRKVGHPTGDLFSAPALKLLADASQGLMRRINILADKSLLAAFAAGAASVDVEHVRAALRDSEYQAPPAPRMAPAVKSKLAIAAGVALALIALAAMAFSALGGAHEPDAPQPVATAPAATSDPPNFADQLAQMTTKSAAWLRGADAKRLTIQVFQANADALTDLERFLRAPALGPVAERLHVFESSREGRTSYGVLLGDFGSSGEAQSALMALPPELRRHQPHIRSVRQIRAAVSESKT